MGSQDIKISVDTSILVENQAGGPDFHKGEEQRIVGGEEVLPKYSIPWQVSLQADVGPRGPIDGQWAHFCGGSILSKRFVLTAGHCVDQTILGEKGIQLVDITVVSGEHNLLKKEGFDTRHTIKNVVPHPDYILHSENGSQWVNWDFALLELEDLLTFNGDSKAKPVCLPSADDTKFREGTLFNVSGWGIMLPYPDLIGKKFPEKLQFVSLQWVEESVCKLQLGKVFHQREMICVGGIKGKTSCGGDSGGPLTWRDTDSSKVKLVGVVSFGANSCTGEIPAVFGRVTSSLDWIHTVAVDIDESECF